MKLENMPRASAFATDSLEIFDLRKQLAKFDPAQRSARIWEFKEESLADRVSSIE